MPGELDTWLFVINTQTPQQSEFRLIGDGFGPREIDFSFATGGTHRNCLHPIPINLVRVNRSWVRLQIRLSTLGFAWSGWRTRTFTTLRTSALTSLKMRRSRTSRRASRSTATVAHDHAHVCLHVALIIIILLACAGVVTGWEFVSIGGDDVTLSVFDPSGGTLTVVNSTVVTSPADRPEAVSLLCFGADGFAVQPGESDSRNE